MLNTTARADFHPPTTRLLLEPDASTRIARLDIDPAVRRHALEVIDKGYTLVKGAVPADVCHEAIAAFRRLEAENSHIFLKHRDSFGHYPRIVNLHTVLPELARLFATNTRWLEVQDILFGAPTVLYTSLLYESGSEQPIHRDTPLFATRPEYLYFGTTVYLEPSDSKNGCLEVLEYGHTLPELDREALALTRYSSLDDVPANDGQLWVAYQDAVAVQARAHGLRIKEIHADVGDSLIWHPQLPHGGSPIRDRTRTRFSLVMHTTPRGVPVYHQDAFFRPSRPLPETARWGYDEVDGRGIANHTRGFAFGTDSGREYSPNDLA